MTVNMHPRDRDLLTQSKNVMAAIIRIQDGDLEQLPPSLQSKLDQITDLHIDISERLAGYDIENN